MKLWSRSRILVTALAAGLVLTACGTGPGQVGAAVIMGDQVVSVTQVQRMLDDVVRQQPAAQVLTTNHRLDLVSRELVSQLVVHGLLTRAAAEQGLRVNEQQLENLAREDKLSQPVSANGSVPPTVLVQQLAASARDHREVYRDELLLQQLGEKAFNHLGITFDFTTVSMGNAAMDSSSLREQAIEKAQALSGDSATRNRIFQADKIAGIGQVGQYLAVQNNDLPGISPLFGFPVGSVVALQPDAQSSSWLIASIKQRDENVAEDAGQTTGQTPPVDQDYLIELGRYVLQPVFAKAGVKISPRYGVWDPIAMRVAPNASETSGIVLQAKGDVKS